MSFCDPHAAAVRQALHEMGQRFLGQSRAATLVRQQVAEFLTHHATEYPPPPILLRGEAGIGKELLARLIHHVGPRSDGPFMAVNCAATSPLVLGNEFFGHERDVFSEKQDANVRATQGGKFQIAYSGTVFIDEVGCLPLDLQPTILKALERRSVRRIGGLRDETTDVWVIAATSEDLRAAVRFGSFREDLYKHLTRLDLLIPPLRQRPDDILLLAEHFLASVCAKSNVPPKLLAPDAQSALVAYHWPGNAREVRAVIERVASLYPLQSIVTAAMLALPI